MSFSSRFLRTLSAAAVAVAALLLAACSPKGGDDMLTAAGVSWELAQLRHETLSEVEYRYALRVPEEAQAPVAGRVEVSFYRNDPENHPVILDFLRPEERVNGVWVDGAETDFRTANDHLLVPLPEGRGPGPVRIAIDFTAGDGSLNRNPDFLYALFVPERARYALPIFDQPNLKAKFGVFLDLPRGWTAMANGRQIREEVEGERRRFEFALSDPLPTYLFTFVAGEFQKVTRNRGGRVMEFMHRETDEEKVARNLDAIFDLHLAALDFLEEYTGIPYPFQKIGFVAVPSFQYGGMEHPGAVFYRAGSLFLDESATQNEILGRASLIAHETSHMWFGDLVTMNWFDDVWTKEVFANFMAAKIVHPSFPDVNHELRFVLAHHPAAYGVDRTAGANPIRQPLENLRDAGTLYGAIIYQKAPVVMRQLEELVGEETFREGIQEYLSRFSFGNATWPDLIQILDSRTSEDLESWSRVWVDEPGRPTVRVDWTPAPDGTIESMVLRQTDPRGEGRIWPQPLQVALGYGETVEGIPLHFLTPTLSVGQAVGRPAPDYVLPDSRGMGYGLFLLDPDSRAFLMENLPGIQDPVVRGEAWLTLWDGVLEGDVAPEAFLDLAMASVREEPEEQILQRLLGNVQTIFWDFLPDDVRQDRAPDVEEVLWAGADSGKDTSRQAAFFRAFRAIALTEDGLDRLGQVWAGDREIPGLTLSEEDRTALASTLALHAVTGWEGILDQQLQDIENPDRRARFEFVLPSLNADPEVREAFFETLREEENREKEPWVLEAVSNLHHPLRRHHALQFITPSLQLLEEIQETGDIFFPGRWVDATLGGHNSSEAADEVRAFLEERPDYPFRLRLKILQAADPLFRAEEILGSSPP